MISNSRYGLGVRVKLHLYTIFILLFILKAPRGSGAQFRCKKSETLKPSIIIIVIIIIWMTADVHCV